jgi:hypothetical protein
MTPGQLRLGMRRIDNQLWCLPSLYLELFSHSPLSIHLEESLSAIKRRCIIEICTFSILQPCGVILHNPGLEPYGPDGRQEEQSCGRPVNIIEIKSQ